MKINKDIKKAFLYIFTTYLLSWSMIIFANTNMLLATLGVCIPSITGILFIIFSKSGVNKDLRKRIFNFKLIGFLWYIVIIFTLPVLCLLSIVILNFLGVETPKLDKIFQVISNPAQVSFLIFFVGLGAGIGEEFGWRGYLLDLFQKRYNAFISSLIVGVFWAAWHIPLRIQMVNLFSFEYIIDFMMIVSFSFLITWIYNNNNRSILSAILTHCMINPSLLIFGGGTQPSPYMSLSITLLIMILIMVISIKTHEKGEIDLNGDTKSA